MSVTSTFKHGLSGYNKHSCRCDVCRAAKSERAREYSRRPEARERKRKYMLEYRRRKGRRPERCRREYRLEYNRNDAQFTRSYKRIQVANENATRRGRWTPGEVKLLHNPHLTSIEIAELLERSYASVKHQRAKELR